VTVNRFPSDFSLGDYVETASGWTGKIVGMVGSMYTSVLWIKPHRHQPQVVPLDQLKKIDPEEATILVLKG